MIRVNDVNLKYGDRVLFDKLTLNIKQDARLAIVGRNGVGKSTLFHLIMGDIAPDSGQIDIPKNARCGILTQHLDINPEHTVKEAAALAFKRINSMNEELDRLTAELGERMDYESDSYHQLIDRISSISEQLQHMEVDQMDAKLDRVLKGLGFKDGDLNEPVHTFSGGWKMRVQLAKLLLENPDYLFLDEPTNHLDIEAILWMEDFLSSYSGAVILISHDKQFLDKVCRHTAEITLRKVSYYSVPYSKYLVEKEDRDIQLKAAYENQQKVIEEKERTIKRFMAKATKTSMAQSMQKQLDKMERINYETDHTKAVNIRFLPSKRSSLNVVRGQNLSKVYDDLTVFKNVDFSLERGERVAFVGQNGQGKTTLAKILSEQLSATSGTLEPGSNVQRAFFAQDEVKKLPLDRRILDYMEDEAPEDVRTKVRSILGAFQFSGEDVEKKISVLSGGERMRLAFAKMLMKPINFLILDEPTHHLDIQTKDILKQALMKYDNTLLIVSHDRDFLSGLTDKTYEFKDQKIKTYLGDINYLLAQRQVDDMRTLEKRTVEKKKEEPTSKMSAGERRDIQKKIRSFEKKIENLEAKIAEIEAKMMDATFFKSPEAAEATKVYDTSKKELATTMEQWEEWVMKIDE